jgi:hypothetical protein
MKKVIKLMKEYAKRHNIEKGLTLILEDDESGEIQSFSAHLNIFDFNSIKQLKEKLKS